MKVNILGVEIDKVTEEETVDLVEKWLKIGGKHYVVTPNIEFIMAAQDDLEFRKILNKADLAIPDSARIGWAQQVLQARGLKKLTLWPLFLFPFKFDFPVTTGTDLMAKLITESNQKGYTIGFLGGQNGVAIKLLERLKERYPKLKIGFVSGDLKVDQKGQFVEGQEGVEKMELPIDILFVAFGQKKQENWMVNNLNKLPVKVMIGVGGAFDYLSGQVPRAPKCLTKLGFEWLFRLLVQPQRIIRFLSLAKFLYLVLIK